MSMIDLNNKRVFVTGGNGFLGTYVVEGLKKEGCLIFSPSRSECDLTKENNIIEAIKNINPDIIIHLAAFTGGIGANKEKPGEFFYYNLMMGCQLMEHARLNGVEKVVNLGTACCYPKVTPVPFLEENLWDGYPDEITGYYGLAKKMLLVQSDAYRKQYAFNSIFLMPANLYGPRDHFVGNNVQVIASIINKFAVAKKNNAKEVVCWGTGKATREFLYVSDCANAIIEATKNYDSSMPINIGTGIETTIADITEQIRTCIGYEGSVAWDESMPEGQPRRCLDNFKAKEFFGFEAKVKLEDGIKQTIEWYLNNIK